MKAIVIHAPGDLRIDDFPEQDPGPDQVVVRISKGGICGSDLHYFRNGGFGAVRIREPMALGHEVSGVIAAIGENVTDLAIGDKVAVNPSKPCGHCKFCQEGRHELCLNMQFFGSAMRFPHAQGTFREKLLVDAKQAIKVPQETPLEEAAFCEPLSVALHAVRQAGTLVDKRVLVTGSGTIGCLVVACARFAGATEIVVTDVVDSALAFASKAGADRTINVATDPAALEAYNANNGYFDAAFECSGTSSALGAIIEALAPLGTANLLGMGGDVSIPVSRVVTKEIDVRGSFRFDREFSLAAELISKRAIDVRPLMTGIFPMKDAVAAFETATDKTKSLKVLIDFA